MSFFPNLRLLPLLGVVAISTCAYAYEPLRTTKGLKKPQAEKVLEVSTARVVLADYGLLRRDFKELQQLSDAGIDVWLLKNTAFISNAQAAQSVVNSPIQVGARTTMALRPQDYGRALVYRIGADGLMDGKGTGSHGVPKLGGHSDGLSTLGEATREFLYEKLVRTVLLHSGSAFETVEHYAVIDWGFDVIQPNGRHDPAGMILRQAHIRAPGDCSSLGDAPAREVEMTLRRYGLTSAGAYRIGEPVELINIQGTADGAILDFGGFLSVDEFKGNAKNFDGVVNLIEPGQIDFISLPDQRLRVPFDHWGFTVSRIEDPKFDNPSVWSHQLARNYEAGRASRRSFGKHFETLVGDYRRLLVEAGGAARPGIMEGLLTAIRQIH